MYASFGKLYFEEIFNVTIIFKNYQFYETLSKMCNIFIARNKILEVKQHLRKKMLCSALFSVFRNGLEKG